MAKFNLVWKEAVSYVTQIEAESMEEAIKAFRQGKVISYTEMDTDYMAITSVSAVEEVNHD